MKFFALRIFLSFTLLAFAGGCGSDASEEVDFAPSGDSGSVDPEPGPMEKFEPRGGRGVKPDDP